MALLLSVAACSAPETETASESAPIATATPTATTAPESMPVDLLPLLDGVAAAAPEGWVAGTCEGLSFSSPADWEDASFNAGVRSFINYAEAALIVENPERSTSLGQSIAFACEGEKTDWYGGWDAEDGTESFRLDVSGAAYAAIKVTPLKPYNETTEGVTLSGTIFDARIHLVTPDMDYYTVTLTLPANNSAYDLVRQVASSLNLE
ncbi:hypothetical protein [Cryobacterium aureum]|uniref:hypothetical protein n=1 Tax=Cryobacterium aureum TaxID=995037 RepID=UPI00101AEA7F|nr:hypothetical protein [Cryobacterium aureum]